jgi:hypothetical protein
MPSNTDFLALFDGNQTQWAMLERMAAHIELCNPGVYRDTRQMTDLRNFLCHGFAEDEIAAKANYASFTTYLPIAADMRAPYRRWALKAGASTAGMIVSVVLATQEAVKRVPDYGVATALFVLAAYGIGCAVKGWKDLVQYPHEIAHQKQVYKRNLIREIDCLQDRREVINRLDEKIAASPHRDNFIIFPLAMRRDGYGL